MAEEQATVDLPDELRDCFWDYDPERLSWERSRPTIVLRLLERGGLHAVRWLRRHLSDEEIRDFIVGRRGRGISPRRLRFWSLVVEIPRREVDTWIEAARRNPWHDRTHG
jgi:hypothetical protein